MPQWRDINNYPPKSYHKEEPSKTPKKSENNTSYRPKEGKKK
jgi:hypothetical protein